MLRILTIILLCCASGFAATGTTGNTSGLSNGATNFYNKQFVARFSTAAVTMDSAADIDSIQPMVYVQAGDGGGTTINYKYAIYNASWSRLDTTANVEANVEIIEDYSLKGTFIGSGKIYKSSYSTDTIRWIGLWGQTVSAGDYCEWQRKNNTGAIDSAYFKTVSYSGAWPSTWSTSSTTKNGYYYFFRLYYSYPSASAFSKRRRRLTGIYPPVDTVRSCMIIGNDAAGYQAEVNTNPPNEVANHDYETGPTIGRASACAGGDPD